MDPELETKMLNHLQDVKRRQTAEQLAEHCKTSVAAILVELIEQQKSGHVVTDTNGVWSLVRYV